MVTLMSMNIKKYMLLLEFLIRYHYCSANCYSINLLVCVIASINKQLLLFPHDHSLSPLMCSPLVIIPWITQLS